MNREENAAESCAAFPAAGCPTPRWCEADGRVCARRDIAAYSGALDPERCVEQRAGFDCMTACLATIFACRYEDAPVLADPVTFEPVEQWFAVMTAWVRERGFWPQNFSLTTDMVESWGERPARSPWGWPTLWMGSVLSPRFTEADGTPGSHAVVCRGSDIVWDPHPLREQGHIGFMGAEVFLPLDPGRLVLRAA